MDTSFLDQLFKKMETVDEGVIGTIHDVYNVVKHREDPLAVGIKSAVIEIAQKKAQELDRQMKLATSAFGDTFQALPEQLQDFYISTMSSLESRKNTVRSILKEEYQ